MGDIAHSDFAHIQDVMGSLPMLKRYILFCMCFTLDENIETAMVEHTLRGALSQLALSVPYLAGQVIYEGHDEQHSGVPKIIPLADTIGLIVNDLRHADFPSMSNLRRVKYPFSCLDPDILAPSIASTWTTDHTGLTAPVLLFQANFVKGGLMLVLAGNHTIMDMTGIGQIISLLAKACRNEPYSVEEIQQANQNRNTAVPLFADDSKPGPEIDDYRVRPATGPPSMEYESPPTWAYFNFTPTALLQLKKEASQQEIVPYVSTDDAIAAFYWQRISQIRRTRLGDGIKSTFARPISIRDRLGLKGYIGHMVDCVYESETDVWQRSIGEIAGRLRFQLRQDAQIIRRARTFATELARLDDKAQLALGAGLNPSCDLAISSWTNVKCCELSFGPHLRHPDAARVPSSFGWPAMAYFMPKSPQGEIAIAVCLEKNHLDLLRKDEVFSTYAEYVG